MKLTVQELDAAITALDYGKQLVKDGSAPHDIKTETLKVMDSASSKMRAMRKDTKCSL